MPSPMLPAPTTIARCWNCGHAASLFLLPDVRRMYCENPDCRAFHPSDTAEAANARYKAHVEVSTPKPVAERQPLFTPMSRN